MVGAVVLARRETATRGGAKARPRTERCRRSRYYLVLSRRCCSRSARPACFVRRNLIMILLSIELMLNAVNLTFVAFARAVRHGRRTGHRVLRHDRRRGEAAVGLAIVIGLFRHRESLNPDAFAPLKW